MSPPYARIICIVLDGVGVGAAPDADRFGDAGSDSIGNTSRLIGRLRLPNMGRMGLGRIVTAAGVAAEPSPVADYGRMAPRAAGKDSTSGHWELMGCVLERPLPTYPDGFPPEIIAAFEAAVGRKVLGNEVASGTEIIRRLGARHRESGRPIVYTSQDSVFQLAAHEDVVSREELYEMCAQARRILVPPHGVGRVIARPFAGRGDKLFRTEGRRDFSIPPPAPTVLDALVATGRRVLAIGKIDDLFAGRGISIALHTKDNREGMRRTLEAVEAADGAAELVLVNLVDFDTMWGHRNDARAYALGLEEFDSFLSVLTAKLRAGDLLMITSDHGNDPTTDSTDHSRELVPLLVYDTTGARGRDLGTRDGFSDVAATIAANFTLDCDLPGKSFLATR